MNVVDPTHHHLAQRLFIFSMVKIAGEIEAAYASSDRSMCKKCHRPISKGSLRIGEWMQSKHYDGLTVNWHHASCWCKSAKSKVKTVNDLKGLLHMRPHVQLELCRMLELQPPDDVEVNFDDSKMERVVAKLNRNEPLTPSQSNAAVWYIKDQIEDLSLAQLRDVMKNNNQPITGYTNRRRYDLSLTLNFPRTQKLTCLCAVASRSSWIE
jgi:hypothetical protein